VKLREYVTEGVMKVPEKFGFNRSNLSGLGISPSMWRAVD
jgi:hypothetical protein